MTIENFKRVLLGSAGAALLALTGAARADVEIDNKPTSNMDCESGVCTATAQKAVLNVSDLANMLAGGDVAVKTGAVAKDIDIDQPLTWTSTSRLTLDAQRSVQIGKQMTVAGQGSLTVVTNDTGNNGKTSKAKNNTGEFIVVPERGSVQFWDSASSLIIDGQQYTLVYDIKTLAADIASNPSGFYALAKPYDASADGTYTDSPITTLFTGAFDGLGNYVSDLSFSGSGYTAFGFFAGVWDHGSVRDFGVTSAMFNAPRYVGVGLIAGESEGAIANCWATGIIRFGVGEGTGGLVGLTSGSISRSYAKVRLYGNSAAEEDVGGLVGYNVGSLSSTYASGTVAFKKGNGVAVAGLVGENDLLIENSFSRSHVADGKNCCSYFGGLVGKNAQGAEIRSSYAAGKLTQNNDNGSVLGGLIGFDSSDAHSIKSAYWDLEKGVSDPSQGAGNIPNDPGIAGLRTKQFQKGLPKGFDPTVWGQDAKVNGGFPYLKALFRR